eukprot:TRINITY_DN9340_c0_g1_i1.p1 TRINITY_DN9340_c0_g1~~TRINITY_DN9340_c0_g1_i1.p1  ORF type:complete len:544 (-),score=112.85 TRINITY_DN9340_c0_g1_i1:150-1781(-)
MALVEAQMAATYNKDDLKVVDHHTYVFCGDGCLMEGVALEALSLAGHLALNKLVVIYDDNKITIDGSTSVAFTENTAVKYAAMGFNIITVEGGNHDYDAMRKAISDAKASTDKPTLILLKTVIGFGSKMEGTAKVHGSPLGADDIVALKTASGRDPTKTFHVTDEEYAHFRAASIKGAAAKKEWNATLEKYTAAHGPELAARIAGTLPDGWKAKLPLNGKSIATRKASENALAEIIPAIPAMLGGSADLTGSNLTRPGEAALVDFQKVSQAGRYIRFGVREHGMCGIMNGMHAHGGSIPFGGTFLNFIGYALGSVRLASMSHHQAIYVATHDSIGLGEDGPTHQPTELLASLRALPNFMVMRPSDQTETSACWALAIESNKTPSCLCLSRQNTVPQEKSSFEGVYRGAYTVVEAADPQAILIATGSEVSIAVDAAKLLEGKLRVRVVSMPIQSVFDAQPEEYKNTVLTEGIPTLSIEAFHPSGWEKYSHFHLGLTGFGASAPAGDLYKHFGLTATNAAAKTEKLVEVLGAVAPKKRAVALALA